MSRQLVKYQVPENWIRHPKTAFKKPNLSAWMADATSIIRSNNLLYWIGPLAVTILAALLRFIRLDQPGALVFDETYYVKDGYSMTQSGYERTWGENANKQFEAGDFSGLASTTETGMFVVHPPVGKWMIGFGMQLFGADNAFGWRFSTALVGTLAVLLIALIAQKLFSSWILGVISGLLLAVDGHAIVQSRTSLLDNFVMFFALLAFGALLLDRSDGRRRLTNRLSKAMAQAKTDNERSTVLKFGPFLGIRWWRIAAGIALGLCTGTKWSGIFFVAAFGLLTVAWDASARRRAGVKHWFTGTLLKDSPLAFISIVGVGLVTYVASWSGWLASSNAYGRTWAKENPGKGITWLPEPLRSLWNYHEVMYNSTKSINSPHPYSSKASEWFFMARPTAYYSSTPKDQKCGAGDCTQIVNSVGNPIIWWAGALAIIFAIIWWIVRRDWRIGAVLCGWAAGYVPWLFVSDRTIFFFYAIAYEPFMILALTFCLGLILGRAGAKNRQYRIIAIGVFLVAVVLMSALFMPIWTAEPIAPTERMWRLWFPGWN